MVESYHICFPSNPNDDLFPCFYFAVYSYLPGHHPHNSHCLYKCVNAKPHLSAVSDSKLKGVHKATYYSVTSVGHAFFIHVDVDFCHCNVKRLLL